MFEPNLCVSSLLDVEVFQLINENCDLLVAFGKSQGVNKVIRINPPAL